jgi:hypothetical protein
MPEPKPQINPAYAPDESPINFQRMAPGKFRLLFEQQGYQEVAGQSDASHWRLAGVFIARDQRPDIGNVTLTRLVLEDADGDLGYIDLTPTSAVALARHLIEFAIASANTNGEPQVIARDVLALIRTFTSAEFFGAFRRSVMQAAEEQIRAKLLVESVLDGNV